MSKKGVIVELPGTTRVQTGRKEVSIVVEGGANWRDVVTALARASPALVGEVITADRRALAGSYVLNWGGRRAIRDLDEEARLEEGDRLILLDTEAC